MGAEPISFYIWGMVVVLHTDGKTEAQRDYVTPDCAESG